VRKINLKTLKFLSNCSLGIVVFALTIAPVCFKSSKAKASEPYPPDYTQKYLQECLATSMTEGLTEPDAKKLCNCTLVEFQKKYSLEAFKELTAKAKNDEAAANELISVGELCFESILYE
jgi:hypothetical protein